MDKGEKCRLPGQMMEGGHGQTNQLHDINWGVRDHASHAPQSMSRNHLND